MKSAAAQYSTHEIISLLNSLKLFFSWPHSRKSAILILWHAYYSLHWITQVFQMFQSHIPGEKPVARLQMFYQGRLTHRDVHEPQGCNLSSHLHTLSLSCFLFIFHSITSVPFTLSPFFFHNPKYASMPSEKNTQTWFLWTTASNQ